MATLRCQKVNEEGKPYRLMPCTRALTIPQRIFNPRVLFAGHNAPMSMSQTFSAFLSRGTLRHFSLSHRKVAEPESSIWARFTMKPRYLFLRTVHPQFTPPLRASNFFFSFPVYSLPLIHEKKHFYGSQACVHVRRLRRLIALDGPVSPPTILVSIERPW